MILRPVDETGDILPVLSSADLLRGAEAAALLAENRLNLYAGDWWEHPSAGNEILELLRESRLTEADGRTLSAYLVSYLRETPGVREISDIAFRAEGRRFFFSCTIETDAGSAGVSYEFQV